MKNIGYIVIGFNSGFAYASFSRLMGVTWGQSHCLALLLGAFFIFTIIIFTTSKPEGEGAIRLLDTKVYLPNNGT